MNREYHKWFSPALGREMELLVYGHGGARVLVFPSSLGRFYEWEDFRMIDRLAEHLERGWIQMYCVDSVDAESWYARHRHPGERAWRHVQYDRYLVDEVLPLTRAKNPTPFFITTGASLGAYHAVNFALRYPQLVSRTIGMSGMYDIREQTGGYSDEHVYFNNPVEFIRGEHEAHRLEALRRQDIILAIGRDDPMRPNNDYMSHLLWEKGIGNAYRVWDGWAHDWPWWREMIVRYIGGHD
jgi:esterase/lipase superfamily enzyme